MPASTTYEGLLALLENEFPKTCACCQRTYATLTAFVDETRPTPTGTGLMSYALGGGDARSVAMMRNCACGSTMATFCADRRDLSAAGRQRRARFEKLVAQLQESGMDALVARAELLAFLRGERSPTLERLGFFSPPGSRQPEA